MEFQGPRKHGKRPSTSFVFLALHQAVGLADWNDLKIVPFVALEYKYPNLSLSRVCTNSLCCFPVNNVYFPPTCAQSIFFEESSHFYLKTTASITMSQQNCFPALPTNLLKAVALISELRKNKNTYIIFVTTME